MKLSKIASLVHGEIFGDPDLDIRGVAGINEAQQGDITFLSGRRHVKDLPHCRASCIIVQEPLHDLPLPQLKVANPHLAFAKLLEHFYVKLFKPRGVSKDALISDKATIGEDVSIFPYSFIADGAFIGNKSVIHPFAFIGENASIGENCVIYPHVTLREKVKVGNRVIIHAGSVIGSDGFGYVFDEGKHHKIPQVGGVIIEDDVEIGANATIDRATTGNTVIGKGTKIDNLVQIGHNVTMGNNCLIVAQVGIGGSTAMGDYVTLGGQVGVSDHTVVESGTMIGAQSGVMGNVAKGTYSGSPAIPHRDWLKAHVVIAKLPELYKRIKELEDKLRELERRNIK
ncbi:MAG: lpxD [Nitrospirae bacterium]|nr:lpxD [Nitrospirota bacterium]